LRLTIVTAIGCGWELDSLDADEPLAPLRRDAPSAWGTDLDLLYTGDLSSGEIERSSEPCGGEKPVGLEVIATIFSADNLCLNEPTISQIVGRKL
jgi:hypothetical protein